MPVRLTSFRVRAMSQRSAGHPFLFFIRDRQTRSILFLGRW
jgi:serine protease inhibitor